VVGPDIPRRYGQFHRRTIFCILDSNFRISFIAFGPQNHSVQGADITLAFLLKLQQNHLP
jgi:hypothetical protein